MADNFDRREHQISRIRETAHDAAKRIRRIADDIDRVADSSDYTKIPDEVMNLVLWGMANAAPDSPARQLRELLISDSASEPVEKTFTETAEEIADRISSGRSIGGFSGIEHNTRRIVKRAVLQAVRAARGIPCEECGSIEHHKMDCSVGRMERSPRPMPAEYVEEGENR